MKLLAVLFLIGAATACRCIERPFCEQTMEADILFRAVVIASNIADIDTVYSLNVTDVFKGNSSTSLTTPSSSTCNFSLEVGVEYLIGTDSKGYAHFCGPTRPWANLTADDLHILAQGGQCDACLNVQCSSFQNCHITSNNTAYCADFCSPKRCNPDEICTLKQVECFQAPCPEVAVCESCLKDCTQEYDPWCGSDGNTYRNYCQYQNAACSDPYLVSAYPGECTPKCYEFCPAVYQPVCGSDGKTYNNFCILKSAICAHPNLKKAYDGKCKKNCPDVCPGNYHPVCASNGKAYSNECYFEIDACQDPNLTKLHDGSCSNA